MAPPARVSRRDLLAAGTLVAAAPLLGCGGQSIDGVVTYPARSLAYAPLLLAVRDGLNRRPAPVRLALSPRSSGAAALAAVASGAALAAAVPSVDLLAAAAEGAPLAAFGALTRAAGIYLVASPPAAARAAAASGPDPLADGRWRALRVGVQTGSEGTETAARLALLARAGGSSAAAPGEALLDPFQDEPRWVPHSTGEGLVAAINDGRIAAFWGRSMAAAQATLLGEHRVLGTYTAAFPLPAASLCTVLVARRDTLSARAETGRLLFMLRGACASAAARLGGPEGVAAARAALPERDALHLSAALRLDGQGPGGSVFASDGRLPADALATLADLVARAGRTYRVDARWLSVEL